jgi:hypothetical protein
VEPVELVLLIKAVVDTALCVHSLRRGRDTPSDKS